MRLSLGDGEDGRADRANGFDPCALLSAPSAANASALVNDADSDAAASSREVEASRGDTRRARTEGAECKRADAHSMKLRTR